MAEFKLEPLPFEEAIEFFKNKLPLTPQDYDRLSFEARTKAFTISGVAALDVLHDIYQELLKALETGATIEDFRKNANTILEKKGWRGLTPYRTDNIFRTNIQTAYNVGRYRQMTDPNVLKMRPYWRYDAVDDQKTRPSHRALDNKVYPADHPFWDTWYPPNGFRCRCSVESLTESQVKRRSLEVSTDIPQYVTPPDTKLPIPLNPDPGFAHNPAKVEWQPDLKKYPAAFRKAYEARARKGGDA
ncbi:MAG: phage minor head protein [Peptococcaceae bacterium]|jgi:SPP1 gp7 family putative phage head morphogenesis protein|nr:phage minor head protein [Peptococcaceae bacterium]MDH7526033.1 phage minor head protein [Peptococcaceae bacterium]